MGTIRPGEISLEPVPRAPTRGLKDLCRGCPDRILNPDGSTLCRVFGWDNPGFDWMCPEGKQEDLKAVAMPRGLGQARVMLLDLVKLGRYPEGVTCYHTKCKEPMRVAQLAVSRIVGSGGSPGKNSQGPSTHRVLYHYTCAREVGIVE